VPVLDGDDEVLDVESFDVESFDVESFEVESLESFDGVSSFFAPVAGFPRLSVL
jgi:hypothetical protein